MIVVFDLVAEAGVDEACTIEPTRDWWRLTEVDRNWQTLAEVDRNL